MQIEQAELELDERKAGAGQAAQRRKDNTQLDLDLRKQEQLEKADKQMRGSALFESLQNTPKVPKGDK